MLKVLLIEYAMLAVVAIVFALLIIWDRNNPL